MRYGAPAVIAVLAALAVATFWPERETRTAVSADARVDLPASAAPAAVQPSDREGCHFKDGFAARVELALDTEARIAPEALGLPAGVQNPPMRHQTHVQMDVELLGADEGDAILLARFGELRSSARIEGMTSPFLLRVASNCALEGFARARATSPVAGRAQQAIAYELDFRWPGQRAEGDAENAIGSYLARYGVASDARGTLVQRRVLRYDELWDGGARLTPALDNAPESSLLTVHVGEGAWFASMRGNEVRSGEGGRVQNAFQAIAGAAQDGALHGASRDGRDYVWEDLLPQSFEVRAPRPITEADRRRQARVRHLSVEASVAQYVQRVEAEVGFQDTWPPLTDYLEARPRAAVPLIHMIQRGEIAPSATAGVYVALGRARTSEAREVLMAVVRDEGAPPFERTRAAFAMIDRDDVTAGFASYLQQQTQFIPAGDPFGREAALVLGAFAGLQEDAEIMTIAGGAAGAILDAGGNEARALRPGFGLIGNTGDASLLTQVEPYTRHPNPDVREAAVHALGGMHPDDVGTFVSEWLGHEEDRYVLRRLYLTLERQTYRHQTRQSDAVIAEAIERLPFEPSHVTRKALIRIIGAVAETNDDARRALRDQIPVELDARTGLYSIAADFLSASDVRYALSRRAR